MSIKIISEKQEGWKEINRAKIKTKINQMGMGRESKSKKKVGEWGPEGVLGLSRTRGRTRQRVTSGAGT